MLIEAEAESVPYVTPTKQSNASTKFAVPSPGIKLTLNKATSILDDTCNTFTFDVHASMGCLFFGMKPKENESCVWNNLPVNWNETHNFDAVLQTVVNYSGSTATLPEPNKHLPNHRADLVAFLTVPDDTPGTPLDVSRQVNMRPLVHLSADYNTPRATLIREGANGNWPDEMIVTWSKLLLMDFYKDETKMLIAKELGLTEEWGGMLEYMNNNPSAEESEGYVCEETGKVYTAWKNFRFLELCSGKMPFAFDNIEGKHYAMVVSSLATCMFVDTTDGTIGPSNIITYDYLIQHGIIKEGVQGREFIDDIEDMMMGKNATDFTSKPSTVEAYYLSHALTGEINMPTVMAAASTVSECISEAKKGSNTPKAVDLVLKIVRDCSTNMSIKKIDEQPDFSCRNWVPIYGSMTATQLEANSKKSGSKDEQVLLNAPLFMNTSRYRLMSQDTQCPIRRQKFIKLLSANNSNGHLSGQDKRACPPYVNTFTSYVEKPSVEKGSNPMHLLNTSKVNIVFFFVMILPLLYAEMKNKLLSQLKDDQELTELINIGVIYLCNVTFNKSDLSFHRGISMYHAMFENDKVHFSIESESHHLLLAAVFLARLCDSMFDLDEQHCVENATRNTRGRITQPEPELQLQKVQQQMHTVQAALSTMSAQFKSPAVLRYNCGEFHQCHYYIRDSRF